MFPARSVTSPVIDNPKPSPDGAAGGEQYATPESESAHVKLTVAVLFTQPFAFGEGLRTPVIVGGVTSMFRLASVVLAVFPARSVQVPWTD